MDSPVQWCDLPSDLLESISQLLDSDISHLRFRSVCPSWRCSLPPLCHSKNPLSRFPRRLPFWSSSSSSHCDAATTSVSLFFFLKESTIYKIEPAYDKPSKSSSEKNSWLVKLKEIKPGKMRILDLLSNDKSCGLPETLPEVIDLSDFRMTVIRKAYHIERRNCGEDGVPWSGEGCYYSLNADKVAISSSGKDYAIMAIHSVGKLGFLRAGDKKWTVLDDTWNVLYEDIISYEGGFCVVDDKGKTVTYDLRFRASELAPALPGGGGHKKHLVDSSGDLLLVDKYVKHVWQSEFSKSAVEFKVYKINREEEKWEELKGLGGEALFVGEDCSFSISAGDFPGLRGNCIFYRDYRNSGQVKGLSSDGSSGIFNLEAVSIRPFAFNGGLVFPCSENLRLRSP